MSKSGQEIDSAYQRLLIAWPKVDSFFHELDAILQENEGMEQASKTLVRINNVDGMNIVHRFSLLQKDSSINFWMFKRLFGKMLPWLKTKPCTLLLCLTSLQDESQGDLAAAWILNDVKQMAVVQPEFAMQLVEQIKRMPKIGFPFLSNLLIGISNSDFSIAYKASMIIYRDGPKELCPQALRALSLFEYGERDEYIQKTYTILKQLVQNNDDNISESSVIALGHLLSNAPVKIGNAVKTLAVAGSEPVRSSLPYVLFLNRKFASAVWFREALLALSDLDEHSLTSTGWMDHLLASLCSDRDEICIEYVELWLKIYPAANTVTVFNSLINCISSNQYADWLSKYIPKWLIERNPGFWRLAGSIFDRYAMRLRSQAPSVLWFSKKVLDNITVEDIHYLIRKTIAYSFAHPYLLCTMVLSCLRKQQDNTQINGFVSSYFIRIIGKNYYGTTKEILTNLQKTGTIRQKQVACDILRALDEYYSALKSLSSLSEQKPSAERWAEYQRIQHDESKVAMKKASVNSISHFIAPEVPLKYGHRFMFRKVSSQHGQDFELSDPSELRSIQISLEIPRMLIIDPVGMNYFLDVCRSETELNV